MISECTLCQSLLHVILMGKRGKQRMGLSASVHVYTLIWSFEAYLAGGFLQLSHSLLLRRNRPTPKTLDRLQQH